MKQIWWRMRGYCAVGWRWAPKCRKTDQETTWCLWTSLECSNEGSSLVFALMPHHCICSYSRWNFFLQPSQSLPLHLPFDFWINSTWNQWNARHQQIVFTASSGDVLMRPFPHLFLLVYNILAFPIFLTIPIFSRIDRELMRVSRQWRNLQAL